MQFISALFGGQENLLLNAAFALGAVLVLVLLCLWVVKLVLGLRTGLTSRRGRRLAVIESLQLDARHRVSIIRRDNVEHVILTGGSQDVVIESGIAVERPAPRRIPPRPPVPRTAGSRPGAADQPAGSSCTRGTTGQPRRAVPARAIDAAARGPWPPRRRHRALRRQPLRQRHPGSPAALHRTAPLARYPHPDAGAGAGALRLSYKRA